MITPQKDPVIKEAPNAHTGLSVGVVTSATLQSTGKFWTRRKFWIVVVLLALVGALSLYLWKQPTAATTDSASLAKVAVTASERDHFAHSSFQNSSHLLRANISTSKVSNRMLTYRSVFTGSLKIPDQNQRVISAWVSGRIEKLYADRVGQSIRKGQPLFAIYSPDLQVAVKEYLLVKHQGENPKLAVAAAKRLSALGLTSNQIGALETSDDVTNIILSPYSGILAAKLLREGEYVSTGKTLYEVVDLNTLWAMIDVHEDAIDQIHRGNIVTLSSLGTETAKVEGVVEFVSPRVDPSSRTVQVRVVVNNNVGLRPETFVQADFHFQERNEFAVPSSAVTRTGSTDYIWVKKETGFEQRQVMVGNLSIDGYYPVLFGITGDEVIATSGTFLIDADRKFSSTSGSAHNH